MNKKTYKILLGWACFGFSLFAFGYSFVKHNSAIQFPVYTKLSSMKSTNVVASPVSDKYIKEKYILQDCKISEAYLYIVASVNNAPIDIDNGEDICFGANKRCEHIIMNNNRVPLPAYLENTYLYDLSNISLLDYNFETMKVDNYYPNANLLDDINKKTVEFIAKVSSNRKKNRIDEMKIFYLCEEVCDVNDISCGLIPYKE